MIVTDGDVRSVAKAFDCTFDEEHARFLKATSSCNLHACPGSGKTTLLVAKLAILARKWPWRDRGILVLSHTNVARREVEQRLAREPSGAGLLAYPHFVGTIQAFVDRFLALPFLRDVGIGGVPVAEPRLDDEVFAERAARLFYGRGWKDYPQARASLKRNHQEGRGTVATLSYSGPDGLLVTEVGKLPGASTPTVRQLRTLKDRVAAEGIFRYADMFAFAAASLKQHPFLRGCLRRRFPWVFVDEMQDTSKEQEELLDGIFGGGGVVFHKIGDENQAIFAETADARQSQMAWTTAIDLPQSQRLAPKLAGLVSPLTVMRPQVLQGNTKREDRAHTVFLFDDDAISDVLPAFGDLILREWPLLPRTFTAKAVGFRRSPPEKPSVPGSLSDYWSGFAIAPTEARPPVTTLLAAVRHARQLAHVRAEFFGAHRMVSDALARLVEVHDGLRVTRSSLFERCTDGRERDLRDLVASLLRTECTVTSGAWREVVGRACKLLLAGAPRSEVQAYVAWEEDTGGQATPRSAGNIFLHRSADREVSIEVTTIHAVKGETHDATLVLETQFHEHDVGLAIPVLLRERVPEKKGRFIEHMKRLFVGSTRPKELLCLALHRAHANEQQLTALRDLGWSTELIQRRDAFGA